SSVVAHTRHPPPPVAPVRVRVPLHAPLSPPTPPFRSRLTRLLGERISGRGLDDRIGCAVLIEALRRLGEGPPVWFVWSVREEIRSEGHTSELQSREKVVWRLLPAEKKPSGRKPRGGAR